MKWIGLTGGLGSGKSAVAGILRKRGFLVVDADELARAAVAPGTLGLTKVLDHFGAPARTPEGQLDRKKLAEIVFRNRTKLRELEAIIHPLVQEAAMRQKQVAQQTGAAIGFYDVPLLYEKGLQKEFDSVVVVSASLEGQISRAMSRDQLTRDEVLARVENQIPLGEKARRADFVICNNGSLWDLEKEVDRLLTYFGLTI